MFCPHIAIPHFYQHTQPHTQFDLKGSTAGRTVGPQQRASNPNAVLKDLDLDVRLLLEDEALASIGTALRHDTALLRALGVVDYSLLLGVHYVAWGDGEWQPPEVLLPVWCALSQPTVVLLFVLLFPLLLFPRVLPAPHVLLFPCLTSLCVHPFPSQPPRSPFKSPSPLMRHFACFHKTLANTKSVYRADTFQRSDSELYESAHGGGLQRMRTRDAARADANDLLQTMFGCVW